MTSIESFEKELQRVHKDFKILKNQRMGGIATVFFFGEPMFSIPAHGLKDYVDPSYGIELPTGSYVPHRTRPQALAQAKSYVEKMNDPDYMDALLGKGDYSDAKLNAL